MPEIQIPAFVITGLQLILAFGGAFLIALWVSLIIWTFRDVRSRSRDVFAILLATLMVVIFGPLGLLLYFLLRPQTTLAELYERSLEEEALLQDLEERPRCPGCSRQVDEAWIICPDCHTTLKKNCPNCHNSLNLQWNICPFCGARQGTVSADHHHHDEHPEQAEPQPIAAQQTRPMSPPPPEPQSEPEPEPEAAPEPVVPPQAAPEEVTVTTPPTTRSDETRPGYPQTDPA